MSDEFTFASLNIKFFEKMLFHKLWQADCANWKRETKSLWNIIIPRWLILFPIKKASSVELHMSCSASKWGYEAIKNSDVYHLKISSSSIKNDDAATEKED
ncbi:hypothetical protein T4E_2994 [Trichinella pseudospiralis]|uniref:Uncharacterized protein n=1 Tax=Trichinella pseudospiralis TaxID=6337 RepID=A0A0V0YLB2_TRIPS|nr:hypothetical protein T4E_2994 [Trichinella pseudospiralis]